MSIIMRKAISDVLEHWKNDCEKIMDSQKEYNRKALETSIKRLKKMLETDLTD